MSGHSKWKNIAHRKGASDARRAKIFTKIGREMAIAIRDGGPDPVSNTRLKDIIAKARMNNVPNDNIQRMLQKYSGDSDANYESITYEGYGPSGIAVIVETATDNRNRTASDLRHYFDKFGGNLGTSGCVSWQFERKGVIAAENAGKNEDDAMMDALDAGALDFSVSDGVFEIFTRPDGLAQVRDSLEALGYTLLECEEEMVPTVFVSLENEEHIKNMTRLLEMLEDNDDVQNVFHNWDED